MEEINELTMAVLKALRNKLADGGLSNGKFVIRQDKGEYVLEVIYSYFPCPFIHFRTDLELTIGVYDLTGGIKRISE